MCESMRCCGRTNDVRPVKPPWALHCPQKLGTMATLKQEDIQYLISSKELQIQRGYIVQISACTVASIISRKCVRAVLLCLRNASQVPPCPTHHFCVSQHPAIVSFPLTSSNRAVQHQSHPVPPRQQHPDPRSSSDSFLAQLLLC